MKKLGIVTLFGLLFVFAFSAISIESNEVTDAEIKAFIEKPFELDQGEATDAEIQVITKAFQYPDWEVRADAFGRLLKMTDKGFVLKKRYDCEPIRRALVELLARERASEPTVGEGPAEHISGLVSLLSRLREPRALHDIMYYCNATLETYDYLAELGGREAMQWAVKHIKKNIKEVHSGRRVDLNEAETGLELLRRMIGNKKASYTPTEKEKKEIANLMEELIHRFPHPDKDELYYEVKSYRYRIRKTCVEIIGKLGDKSKIPLIQSLATSDKYWTLTNFQREGEQVYPVREEAKKVLEKLKEKQ